MQTHYLFRKTKYVLISSLDISLWFEALATFVLKKMVILCSRYILILVDLVISQSSNCLFSLICHLLTICQHVWWKWPLSLLPLLSEKCMAYHWTCALFILIGWLRKMTQLIKAVPLQIVEKAAKAVFVKVNTTIQVKTRHLLWYNEKRCTVLPS